MTEQYKKLLLKDLCARLLYDVRVNYDGNIYVLNEIDPSCKDIDYITARIQDVERLICAKSVMIEDVKPYLRPMSSMTEEEWEELSCIGHIVPLYDGCFGVDMRAYCKNSQPHYRRFSEFSTIEDWFNKKMFAYRTIDGKDMFELGLAIEAPEGMYNIKEHNKI